MVLTLLLFFLCQNVIVSNGNLHLHERGEDRSMITCVAHNVKMASICHINSIICLDDAHYVSVFCETRLPFKNSIFGVRNGRATEVVLDDLNYIREGYVLGNDIYVSTFVGIKDAMFSHQIRRLGLVQFSKGQAIFAWSFYEMDDDNSNTLANYKHFSIFPDGKDGNGIWVNYELKNEVLHYEKYAEFPDRIIRIDLPGFVKFADVSHNEKPYLLVSHVSALAPVKSGYWCVYLVVKGVKTNVKIGHRKLDIPVYDMIISKLDDEFVVVDSVSVPGKCVGIVGEEVVIEDDGQLNFYTSNFLISKEMIISDLRDKVSSPPVMITSDPLE